jgi:hypothetical protein
VEPSETLGKIGKAGFLAIVVTALATDRIAFFGKLCPACQPK